jgi:hypothetical protein
MSDFHRRVRTRAAQLATVALVLITPAASAQSSADADLKAIQAYTLTMPKYQQYLDATVNLANAAVKNPQLAGKLEGSGEKSVAEQVKLIDGVPEAKAAIGAAGLTTRDFVLTQGALLQAGMAYAMTKDANVPTEQVVQQAGVSRANLEFYQKNEAEIGRLAKEAEARAPKRPESAEGE